jgi:hypothetical protein
MAVTSELLHVVGGYFTISSMYKGYKWQKVSPVEEEEGE